MLLQLPIQVELSKRQNRRRNRPATSSVTSSGPSNTTSNCRSTRRRTAVWFPCPSVTCLFRQGYAPQLFRRELGLLRSLPRSSQTRFGGSPHPCGPVWGTAKEVCKIHKRSNSLVEWTPCVCSSALYQWSGSFETLECLDNGGWIHWEVVHHVLEILRHQDLGAIFQHDHV